jgi:hypothetical protein
VIIVSAWLKNQNMSVWRLKTPQNLRYDTHFKGLSLMLYIIKHITNTSIPLWKKKLRRIVGQGFTFWINYWSAGKNLSTAIRTIHVNSCSKTSSWHDHEAPSKIIQDLFTFFMQIGLSFGEIKSKDTLFLWLQIDYRKILCNFVYQNLLE